MRANCDILDALSGYLSRTITQKLARIYGDIVGDKYNRILCITHMDDRYYGIHYNGLNTNIIRDKRVCRNNINTVYTDRWGNSRTIIGNSNHIHLHINKYNMRLSYKDNIVYIAYFDYIPRAIKSAYANNIVIESISIRYKNYKMSYKLGKFTSATRWDVDKSKSAIYDLLTYYKSMIYDNKRIELIYDNLKIYGYNGRLTSIKWGEGNIMRFYKYGRVKEIIIAGERVAYYMSNGTQVI